MLVMPATACGNAMREGPLRDRYDENLPSPIAGTMHSRGVRSGAVVNSQEFDY